MLFVTSLSPKTNNDVIVYLETVRRRRWLDEGFSGVSKADVPPASSLGRMVVVDPREEMDRLAYGLDGSLFWKQRDRVRGSLSWKQRDRVRGSLYWNKRDRVRGRITLSQRGRGRRSR